eukprot:RCo004631
MASVTAVVRSLAVPRAAVRGSALRRHLATAAPTNRLPRAGLLPQLTTSVPWKLPRRGFAESSTGGGEAVVPPATAAALGTFTEEQREKLAKIERQAEEIYRTKLEKADFFNLVPRERASVPMVLVLGNHSSGKSSFINYLLAQKEQETGVAPTDDSFTVLTRGDAHADQDGHALMTDSRWAFADLKQFGPAFLNHFRLKVRKLSPSTPFPYGMMIVDTPGMIDTPLKTEASNRGARGYDFLKVVRWFAERSDV